MPSWLGTILIGWAKDLAISLFSKAIAYFKKIKRYKKIEEKNDSQAAAVESAAEEIKKLLREGKDVPDELKDRLRKESQALIDGTFIPRK